MRVGDWNGLAAVRRTAAKRKRRLPFMSDSSPYYRKAQRHLARRDPILKRLVKLVGPCTLRYEPDRFAALARSIIAQQISTKAAHSIRTRLEQTLAPAGL